MPLSHFGDWLADHRQKRGYTVRGLAERAGISHATVSKIEDGIVGARSEMVQKLAGALGVELQSATEAWLKDQFPEQIELTRELPHDFAPLMEGYNELPEAAKDFARQQFASAVHAAQRLYGAENTSGGDPYKSGRYSEATRKKDQEELTEVGPDDL